MTTTRQGRRYLATVARGETSSLQGDKSDVKLEIGKGCPKRAYLMEVRTDLTNFKSIIPEDKFIIPDDECFISPIVKVLAPAETSTSSYVLNIPHSLDEDDDRTKVKVRMIHENRNPAVVDVPKGNVGALYYDINARFIELHCTHFCNIVCTICETPYHCRGRINSFWFARFDTQKQILETPPTILHDVEIRPYFGGVLHTTVDFRKSVEETVKLRYVTQGRLKKSKTSFNPELGQIKFSVKVTDPVWKPKQGLDKWDPDSRTFTEEKELWEVMGEENTHRCREPPFEAAVYNLKAEGQKLEMFQSNSKMQMTIDLEELTEEEEKKQEHCTLELPVSFSKDDVFKSSSEGEKISAGSITAGEMCGGYISTSQQSGSSITVGQSVGDQPAIVAGKIIAQSITVNTQANIAADQNVSVVVQPVSDNDVNVFKGNKVATGAKSLPSKEDITEIQKLTEASLERSLDSSTHQPEPEPGTSFSGHHSDREVTSQGLSKLSSEAQPTAGTSSAGAKRKLDSQEPDRCFAQKKKQPKLSKEEINKRVEGAGLNQLESVLSDNEIARLAKLFTASTLETLAVQRFRISQAQVNIWRYENGDDTEGFKRTIFDYLRNIRHSRKDWYRTLLEAESDGDLEGIDMAAVENLILSPEQ